jgi:hypothetical protein
MTPGLPRWSKRVEAVMRSECRSAPLPKTDGSIELYVRNIFSHQKIAKARTSMLSRCGM